jgi:hypothetical protein
MCWERKWCLDWLAAYLAIGRAIAKAVSRQWPGFEPRWGRVGFVVDKVALGQVFSEYFSFPSKFSFHQLLHIHHLSFGASTIGQIVADVPSRLSLTPPPRHYLAILWLADVMKHQLKHAWWLWIMKGKDLEGNVCGLFWGTVPFV